MLANTRTVAAARRGTVHGAWRNGPTSALIEAQVIGWLCELIGYGAGSFGVLASGGSEANLIALKCARDTAARDVCNRGLRAANADLTVYASEQCHFSVEKSVDLLGLGRQSLRKIDTDERFHIRVDLLRAAIERDARRKLLEKLRAANELLRPSWPFSL